MLRRKLRNNTMLIRTAMLEGPLPLAGVSVLYISMMNDATMEEYKLFCNIIVRDHDIYPESGLRVASHQKNHRPNIFL